MANKLNAKPIIKKHEVTVTLTRASEGSIQDGEFVGGDKQNFELRLAIFPMTAKELEKYEGGKYSSQDIQIYQRRDIKATKLSDGSKVVFNIKEEDVISYQNNNYKVVQVTDRTINSNFYYAVATKKVE